MNTFILKNLSLIFILISLFQQDTIAQPFHSHSENVPNTNIGLSVHIGGGEIVLEITFLRRDGIGKEDVVLFSTRDNTLQAQTFGQEVHLDRVPYEVGFQGQDMELNRITRNNEYRENPNYGIYKISPDAFLPDWFLESNLSDLVIVVKSVYYRKVVHLAYTTNEDQGENPSIERLKDKHWPEAPQGNETTQVNQEGRGRK